MSKKLDNFIIGTQYYRAPTPLPDEWEHDFAEFSEAGLDTVQLRLQWRWHERSKNKYTFTDVDTFMDLAEKYDKKIIIKFMMETAPDYIYHTYKGFRIGLNGVQLKPGANGAYYVGGWWPCFDNPHVIQRAVKFVRYAVKRYKNNKRILLWNIWNEPRTRPIGDCCCTHSVKAYQKWLKEKFGSINKLNDFYGKCWENFSTINPPGMPLDYAELFLWRTWAHTAVTARLHFMYTAVRAEDDSRPIIAHVGASTVIQDVAGDGSNDRLNAGEVDFYGTSFPTSVHLRSFFDEAWPFMLCDWMRCVSPYFWVYELYPDWGNWNLPSTNADFKLKLWSTAACGTKGLLIWQYRAERYGHENNLSGLVKINGSFKKITPEVHQFKQFSRIHENFLMKAEPVDDGIGILYSGSSDMISRIEETRSEDMWDFPLEQWPYLYKKALWGIYSLMRELGYIIRWIDEESLAEKIKNLQMLYVPEAFILTENTIRTIESYLHSGGAVIFEEGAGLRADTTWLHPEWPGMRISELASVSIADRVDCRHVDETVKGLKSAIKPSGFCSFLTPHHSKILCTWSDGRAASTQNAKCIFFGTSLGASFYETCCSGHDRTENYKNKLNYKIMLMNLLARCGVSKKTVLPDGVYERVLASDGYVMKFFFNRSGKKQTIRVADTASVEIINLSGEKKNKFRGKPIQIMNNDILIAGYHK